MDFAVGMSSLEDYVNQIGNAEIIRAFAGSAPSIQYFAHQSGVNEPTDLHLLDATIAFKNGKGCSFADSNAFTLSDRQLVPAFMKAETAICYNDMLGKWIGYELKVDANGEEIPFEQAFVDSYREASGEALEDRIWNGITIDGTKYDGLVDIAEAEGTKVAVAADADAFEQARALILALPAKSAKKTEIFVSPARFLALKDALLKRDFRLIDLQFSNGTEVDENTIKMPVFGTLVHAVDGLAENNEMYALVPEHTVYGYSVDDAHNAVRIVYDEVNDRYIFRIKLTSAVQVARVEEVLFTETAQAQAEPAEPAEPGEGQH